MHRGREAFVSAICCYPNIAIHVLESQTACVFEPWEINVYCVPNFDFK